MVNALNRGTAQWKKGTFPKKEEEDEAMDKLLCHGLSGDWPSQCNYQSNRLCGWPFCGLSANTTKGQQSLIDINGCIHFDRCPLLLNPANELYW